MTKLFAFFAVLSCLVLLSVTARAEDIPGSPHLRVANRDVEISQRTTESLVKKVLPYAAMSELAYRTYSTETSRKKERKKVVVPKQRAEGWEQLVSWLTKQHWEFLGHKEYGCEDNETLECDLWINKTTVPRQVVIAFRGTDGDDTASNVRPVLFDNRERDQYAAVRKPEFRKDVMEACGAAGMGVVVTATGHSLGGGLAQRLFYSSQLWPINRVNQAMVFDPSPLTGWYEFGPDEERSAAMSVFNASLAAATTRWRFPEVMAYQYGFGTIRVNERGEVLSYLRSLFRSLEPEESYISVLNFDFEDGGIVSQHSMARLAQNLLYYPANPPQTDLAPVDDSRARLEELYRMLNQS